MNVKLRLNKLLANSYSKDSVEKDDFVIDCPTCHGTGIIESGVCPHCNGTGVIVKNNLRRDIGKRTLIDQWR